MQFIEFPSWGSLGEPHIPQRHIDHFLLPWGLRRAGGKNGHRPFHSTFPKHPSPAGSALVARVLALFLHAALHVMPQSPEFTIAEVSATSVIAQGLGYVVGAGSLLLYTPIAIRICRQRDASGLTLSTWWLKLISYTCSDVYSFANGYLVSTCVALVAALHTFPCSLEGT